MSTKEDIQYALNSLLEEKGAKNKDLAAALGVSRAAVTNWKNGKNSIDVEFIPGICDFFGITVDEFFGRHAPNKLTAEEEILLAAYRSMNSRGQSRLLEEARMMARSGMFDKSEDNPLSQIA